MNKFMMGLCPVCHQKLHIARLSCPECKAEYPLDSELSPFDYLSDEQKNFLLVFLRNEGNITTLENELKISYPTVKKQLNELLVALGLKSKEENNAMINKVEVSELDEKTINSDRASDIVRTKITNAGGSIIVRQLQRDKTASVWLVRGGTKFMSDKLPNYEFTFDIFDIVVDFLRENGGYADKGAVRGFNVGKGKFSSDTISYQIATQYWGKVDGETSFDSLFIIAAILEWAGLVENGRGYLRLIR